VTSPPATPPWPWQWPPRHPARTRLLDEAAARGCVPHPGLPMLAGQVDLILDFPGLSGNPAG
jgi:hypothetical protein